MEIDIEGTHTKLAQVMDGILSLDCVVSIAMIQNGRKIVRRRPQDTAASLPVFEAASAVPPKKQGRFRIGNQSRIHLISGVLRVLRGEEEAARY
jgi:hypothetical protein